MKKLIYLKIALLNIRIKKKLNNQLYNILVNPNSNLQCL